MKKINLGLVILLLVLGACARTVPGQPQDVKVEKRSTGLLITWKDSSSGELEEDKFIIQRAVGTEDFKNLVEILKNTSTTNVLLSYEDKSADLTKVNRYRVGAVIGGKSPIFSKEVKFDPNAQSGEKVKLTVRRDGTGNGKITSNPVGISCEHDTGKGCSGDFTKGSTVTLTAAPNTGSSFVGFSENCTKAGDLSCTIKMDKAEEVTETMVSARPGLNVEVIGDGKVVDAVDGSKINCGGGSNDCLESDYWQTGDIVTLYAEPVAGSILGGWQGCDSVSNVKGLVNGRCDFTLKSVSVVRVIFLGATDIPEIVSFTATPGNIPTGQIEDVTLSWEIDAISESFTRIVVTEGGSSTEMCTATSLDADGKGSCVISNVSESKTYRLTVEGPFDPDPFMEVAVSFGAEPTVELTATPEKLASGDEAVLAWVVGGSETNRKVILSGGEFSNEDVTEDIDNQVKVKLTVDTAYSITVTNDAGTVTDAVTVDVGNKPVITGFTATPLAITEGETVTLSWEVTDETKLTLRASGQPDKEVTGDSTTDTPASETIYTLTAENDFGETVSEPVTVQVGIAPVISDFTINGDDGLEDNVPIAKGGSAEIAWSVGGSGIGLEVKIRRDGDVINADAGRTGSLPDDPLEDIGTITYKITASNAFGGPVSKEIKVDVGDLPVISPKLGIVETSGPSSISDGIIYLGDSADLSWGSSGASTTYVIEPIGTVSGPSHPITPTETGETTYRLTATNRFGSMDGGEATLIVIALAPPEPPLITRFREKRGGGDLTLEWRVVGTPPMTVILDDGDIETAPIEVEPEGELDISPSETTTYTLTATNEFGDFDTEEITVTVEDD